jgi:hypothetical protein
MAEPNPILGVPVAVPVTAIMPPVPLIIEDVFMYCGFTALQADIAVNQDLETCLAIALMIPDQIDKRCELNRPRSELFKKITCLQGINCWFLDNGSWKHMTLALIWKQLTCMT